MTTPSRASCHTTIIFVHDIADIVEGGTSTERAYGTILREGLVNVLQAFVEKDYASRRLAHLLRNFSQAGKTCGCNVATSSSRDGDWNVGTRTVVVTVGLFAILSESCGS